MPNEDQTKRLLRHVRLQAPLQCLDGVYSLFEIT